MTPFFSALNSTPGNISRNIPENLPKPLLILQFSLQDPFSVLLESQKSSRAEKGVEFEEFTNISKFSRKEISQFFNFCP